MWNAMGSMIPKPGQSYPFAMGFADGDGGDSSDGGAGGEGGQGAGAGAGEGAGQFSWKGQIPADVANSPLFKGYDDTAEGLSKASTAYANLEKLLGREKAVIPKDENDKEGWAAFSKALGIPDKAEGYGLTDADVPEGMKNLAFDKQKFAETVHAFKLTPNQAKGLWGAYTEMVKEVYGKAMQTQEKTMTETINRLRSEWGDAYETNVQLGQLVINKFAADKEGQDFLLATLGKDPRGIKFLAKIGSQFAENKIGEFNYQRFSLTPEQAQEEIDKITRDVSHPYNSDKATPDEHERAVDYVNSLISSIEKAKQGQA